MEAGQRDFVIERLEKQLLQKTEEAEFIKNTLRDSIIRELRDEFREDQGINNRLMRLEHKVQELTNTINGVMDELLDQKSMIRRMETPEYETNKPAEPLPYPDVRDSPVTPVLKKNENTGTKIPKPEKPRNTMNFNIRDIKEETNAQCLDVVDERNNDYIIASGNDGNPDRKMKNVQNEGCEYIIAEDKNNLRKRQENKFETVESRDDEDTVITTTHRKESF
jgi:hypothetical protein